jgi:hypothetical protein
MSFNAFQEFAKLLRPHIVLKFPHKKEEHLVIAKENQTKVGSTSNSQQH